ncbi:MAG TPA: FtsQ-type POTRA domain-containing protein [Longimicrobiales bacterium]|nr:FtsQ-type POTRA domain-containing protein [Longimicrobiales bacterium]
MRDAVRGWLLVMLVTAVAAAGAYLAPRALRHMAAFHVQHVEVTGTRYLGAEEVLAASGIVATSTLFDDFERWRGTLLRHPMIVDVAIARRLPATVVLHITETVPLAFAGPGALRPVDARGRLLTADPAQLPLDLPVLAGKPRRRGDERITDQASLRALGALAVLAAHEPELYALASEVVPLEDGVRMLLTEPAGAEILLPFAPDAERLHHLRLTLADVTTARAGQQTPLAQLRRIDARFREQIVVSLKSGGST